MKYFEYRTPFLTSFSGLVVIFIFFSFNCIIQSETSINEGSSDNVSNTDNIIDTSNVTIFSQVIIALAAWDIGLEDTVRYSNTRTLGTATTRANPVNWITTATEDNCDYIGIPDVYKEAGKCAFSKDNTVIGVCAMRILGDTGFIIDSTVIINKTAYDDFLGTAEARNQEIKSTFIHEIGHCLGLQHWGDTDEPEPAEENFDADYKTHIMYYSTGVTTYEPHEQELAAIKSVYNNDNLSSCNKNDLSVECLDPNTLPNASDCGDTTIAYGTYETYLPCYYSANKHDASNPDLVTSRRRQNTFPSFYISSYIGNALTAADKVFPPGAPITGPIREVIYEIKKDGSKTMKYLDSQK